MSKELIAQKNFLFKGRVLEIGERFSTSVQHMRDLVAGKLAVEVMQDVKSKANKSFGGSMPDDENFEQMTMHQLKEVLNEIGVQFGVRASKADLLELVKESFGEDLDAAADQDSSSN